MDLSVFYEVIIPIFEMRHASLICISTPLGHFNFYSHLLNLVDPNTGFNICNVYKLQLVCDRCLKKEHPEQCKHNEKYIPPWKSKEKLDIVKIILSDNTHILQRESL